VEVNIYYNTNIMLTIDNKLLMCSSNFETKTAYKLLTQGDSYM